MDRQELENQWCRRVTDARLRWEFARRYTQEVRRDFSVEYASHDGHFAYQRALHLENLALAEYNHILHIFAALVTEGTIPDEKEWLRHRAAGTA